MRNFVLLTWATGSRHFVGQYTMLKLQGKLQNKCCYCHLQLFNVAGYPFHAHLFPS